MRENQSVEDDEKKLFAFLEYSWTPEYEPFDFFQFSKEYQLQNKHDIGSFRKSIIQELNKNEKNAIFIADYKEIEKKINENPDNENPNYKRLKEFYIGYIIQLCQKQKKPKILEIIDELKSCLSKSNDKEILDFLKSINDKIDNKTNDQTNDQTNKNVIELKKILERHERHYRYRRKYSR